MPDSVIGLFVQLGGMGAFLAILFLGLARGKIYTKSAHDELMVEKEKRIAEKDKAIAKLEEVVDKQFEINKKVDERNDFLAGRVDQLLEISRAHGILQALPPNVGERVIQ